MTGGRNCQKYEMGEDERVGAAKEGEKTNRGTGLCSYKF